jgi:hypothetical protein
MAKLSISAVAMWKSLNLGGPRIAVSVETSNGEPVKNLAKKDFVVGFVGSSASGKWIEQKVTSVESTGASHGFYTLFIANYTLGGETLDWQDFFASSVFTVEVQGGRTKGGGQGRTVVINTPTTPV